MLSDTLTDAIARAVHRSRASLAHSESDEQALDVLAFRVAGVIAQSDPRFDVDTFVNIAGVRAPVPDYL